MNSTDRLHQAADNNPNYDSDTEQLLFVSEDNYREFLQHVDNSVKLQLLRNSEYLIQFGFKREANSSTLTYVLEFRSKVLFLVIYTLIPTKK